NFTIIDGDEALLLRAEIARELFADAYERDEDGSFQRFIDAYGDGNDERLVRQVVSTHDLLCSVVDPDDWRERAYEQLVEGAEKPLNQSALGRALIADVAAKLDDLIARCDE